MPDETPSQEVDYSVVVPVYNSVESLAELYERIHTVFSTTLEATFELILIDDASPNTETWATIQSLHETNPQVVGLQLMRNSGQQNATMCGLNEARGRRIVIMDDDLQHAPEDIPMLVSELEANDRLDVLIGVSKKREHSLFRNIGSYFFGKLMNVLIKKPQNIRFSSFILLDRHVRDALVAYRGNKITTCSLICMNTSNIDNVVVRSEARKYGRSGYSIYKLVALASNHVFNFSSMPLQLMSVVGAIASFLSMGYGAYAIYLNVTQQIGVPGFTTIVVLLSFYSGILMVSLGIIGQYMVRILRATTYGSQYVVRRSAKAD